MDFKRISLSEMILALEYLSPDETHVLSHVLSLSSKKKSPVSKIKSKPRKTSLSGRHNTQWRHKFKTFNPKTLSKLLRSRYKESGLLFNDFVKITFQNNFSSAGVRFWISQSHSPNVESIDILCKCLKVTPSDLGFSK